MKTCTKCTVAKDLSEFYRDHRNKDLYRPVCKVCHNAASTANYERDKRAWRATFYERKYKISIETYEEMLTRQNGCCAICIQPETSEKFKHLSVDHDHKTGEVRGLLCAKCNRLLGVYEKNTKLFEKFDTYLAKDIV